MAVVTWKVVRIQQHLKPQNNLKIKSGLVAQAIHDSVSAIEG